MTAQVWERLTYEGKLFPLLANPLESYFKQYPPRPSFAPESSANWCGYTAHWDITEGRLYLVGLSGRICVRSPEDDGHKSSFCGIGHKGECEIEEVGLSDIFTPSEGTVVADWYTGEIRVPHGKMVEYIHLGYASKHERYLMINIVNGLVAGLRITGSDEYEKERKIKLERNARRRRRSWFWK